jgi:pimeloyl-ACP methyl ester carboxylesterase
LHCRDRFSAGLCRPAATTDNVKTSESLFVDVRGLRYHVRSWGRDGAPKVFVLHGWMDVSASFQFVVDALRQEWQVLAPDWRGFGLTGWSGVDSYWYPDYLGDLDRLLAHFQPEEPVNLVGHSMGGNVACIYSGVRPHRIRRLVNLEGLGMRASKPGDAPRRYLQWLDQLQVTQRFRDYASFADLAARLRERNPRLTLERADFLARHWGGEREDGRVELRSDPAHKRVNPVLYRGEEVAACLNNVSAPVLWVQGEVSDLPNRFRLRPDELSERKACIRNMSEVSIPGAGHMLHHDQPESVAHALEDFLLR